MEDKSNGSSSMLFGAKGNAHSIRIVLVVTALLPESQEQLVSLKLRWSIYIIYMLYNRCYSSYIAQHSADDDDV